MKKKYLIIGLLLTLAILVLHLTVIDNYGLTWDFHFHFFGGAKLLGLSQKQVEPTPLPYTEPDPRRASSLPYGPIMSIVPVASFRLFHQILNWLPADSAYNLPIIFWGATGILILYLFLLEAFNFPTAITGLVFLTLLPRYFGDLHNNMKDVPMAAVFALNVWFLWRLVRHPRPLNLLLASLGFALAFNIKINSIYIPPVFGIWLLFLKLGSRRLPKLLFWYFLYAPLAAFLVWAYFWSDPLGQLKQILFTFGVGTNNIEVLLASHWFCSSLNVPWYYPYWYLGITTPLLILIFFLIGLGGIIFALSRSFPRHSSEAFNSELSTKLLLLLWFFLPLTRYFIPAIGVIDGIRHFEEVIFPLSAIAAVGAVVVAKKLTNAGVIIAVITLITLITPIIRYHPYQITYFNELVGGIKGAFGKYDLDYWGTSQKAAVRWLNAHAAVGSRVYIVMAADVAGKYLRPDLLANLNTLDFDGADYVIVLNRQGFFYRYVYLWKYLLNHKPVFIVQTQGVPLTWVFDNRLGPFTPVRQWWTGTDPCVRKYW